MNRTVIFLAIVALGTTTSLKAQVGIGTPIPNVNSTLDLTDTDNRGLLLNTTPVAAMKTSPNGLVYFSGDKIYYKETGGYNALSPWKYKYNGSTNENVYFDNTLTSTSSGNVGIGIANPKAKLHIAVGREANINNYSNGYLMIGKYGSGQKNLIFDTDEIQARNNTSAAALNLNPQGGRVNVGSGGLSTSGKLKENGNALVPQGVIVMWSGATPPAGWAICNGGSGTPNLTGKFILAATSGIGTGGGQDSKSITLTTGNLPSHSHSFSGSTGLAGGHSHHMQYKAYDLTNNSSHGTHTFTYDGRSSSTKKHVYTDSEPHHTHTVSGTIGSTGSGSAFTFDNRPAYYKLAYIMKL